MLAHWAIYPKHLRLCIRCRQHINTRRCLQTTSSKRALVGPPDPVSNLRPVIYDDIDIEPVQPGRRKRKGDAAGEGSVMTSLQGASAMNQSRVSPTHPYQLDEFDGDPADYTWRLERSRLDAFNHAFWKDSNTRFEIAKQSVLSSLPESATPEAREVALSEFYGKWLQQEHERLKEYSSEWNRRNFSGILIAARAAISRFRGRVLGASKPTCRSQ